MATQPTRRQQSAAVKRALTDAGLKPLSVKWGTGTARGWLDIQIPKAFTNEQEAQAREIARVTLGRRKDTIDHCNEWTHNERISVYRGA